MHLPRTLKPTNEVLIFRFHKEKIFLIFNIANRRHYVSYTPLLVAMAYRICDNNNITAERKWRSEDNFLDRKEGEF